MRLLNVCSGTGSVSLPFKQALWTVVEVDWDPRYKPTHCCDLVTWDCPYEPGYFDVVWCSPDCTQYSRARTTGPPRDLKKADALVQRCLELIDKLQPRLWFVENPDSGLLKTRPCVEGLPYVRVDYCMYSNCPYRKRTRIWTNCTDWTPKMCDRSHCINGRHAATAQRGYKKSDPRSGDQVFTRDELHRLPRALCDEIFSVAQFQSLLINDGAETAQGGGI